MGPIAACSWPNDVKILSVLCPFNPLSNRKQGQSHSLNQKDNKDRPIPKKTRLVPSHPTAPQNQTLPKVASHHSFLPTLALILGLRGSITKRHRKLERGREEKHGVDDTWILHISIHISTPQRLLGVDIGNINNDLLGPHVINNKVTSHHSPLLALGPSYLAMVDGEEASPSAIES
jgi:hypothetical protein